MQMVFDSIMNKPYEPLKSDVDKDLASLVDRMLQKDPNKRPSIWELAKIPCIEEKIKFFYQEHPGENDFQLQQKEELKDETGDTVKIEVENMEEIVFKLREEVKFSKQFKGKIRYRSFAAISGQELFEWLKKNQTWKSDDQIRDSLKLMFESKLVYLVEGGNPLNLEFQINPNAWYSFSRDMTDIPANLTKTYLGQSGDVLEQVTEALLEGKRITGVIIKLQTLDQVQIKALIKDYLNFKSLNQRLQKAQFPDQDKDKQLIIFLNLYQLMRLHKYKIIHIPRNLRTLFNDAQQMQFNEQGSGFFAKLIQMFLPFISGELATEDFSYQFLGIQFTIDEIKHGILRGNSKQKYSNFKPWDKSNPKSQFILPLDPRVIFLFHEDSNILVNKLKIVTDLQKLSWPIDLFKQGIVTSRLEEIVKKWISMNVCLDTIENDIQIHPLLLTYISDFGGTNESLLKWIFKYMNSNIDQEQILNDLKENRFYVTFKDPNEQI